MSAKNSDRAGRWLVPITGCGLWLLALQAGCSSTDSHASATSCKAGCADRCNALAACDDAPPVSECEARCALGTGSADCADFHPDGLSCDDLSGGYACVDYCATLCTRAPSCGAFDQNVCATGCARQPHEVCNSKSVDARSCALLAPELALYDEAGKLKAGESIDHTGFDGEFGLCRSTPACDDGKACSGTTNTCS